MMIPVCEHFENCKHFVDYYSGKDDGEGYDFCHVCAMDHDCFVPAEECET